MKILIAIVVLVVLGSIFWLMNKSDKNKGYSLPQANNIEEALEMDKTQALIAINGLLCNKMGNDLNYANLNKSELLVISVDLLQSDVNNGGFDQYFFNSFSELAYEAMDGLKEIGALNAAEIAEKAFSVFPDSNVPNDRNERQALLDNIGEKEEELLSKVDQDFYKCPDDIDALLIEYIKQHRKDFD